MARIVYDWFRVQCAHCFKSRTLRWVRGTPKPPLHKCDCRKGM